MQFWVGQWQSVVPPGLIDFVLEIRFNILPKSMKSLDQRCNLMDTKDAIFEDQ